MSTEQEQEAAAVAAANAETERRETEEDNLAALAAGEEAEEPAELTQEEKVEEVDRVIKRKPRKRPPSRAQRWADAASRVEDLGGQLVEALDELRSIQEEYENWRDAIEEKFSGTNTYEQLGAICDLDVEGARDNAQEAADLGGEASSAETPRMFGG